MVNRHHADTALFAVFSKCHEHTATSFNAAPVRYSYDAARVSVNLPPLFFGNLRSDNSSRIADDLVSVILRPMRDVFTAAPVFCQSAIIVLWKFAV